MMSSNLFICGLVQVCESHGPVCCFIMQPDTLQNAPVLLDFKFQIHVK
jgi:hypothetical protein